MKPPADSIAESRVSGANERALIDRCRDGDERAWADLYRAYSPIVARFCARMMGPSGPVQNADFDVVDVVTDLELFTPGDNTDASGFFDFVVPAGLFNFEVCPPAGALLVGAELENVTITGGSVRAGQPGSGGSGGTAGAPGVSSPMNW